MSDCWGAYFVWKEEVCPLSPVDFSIAPSLRGAVAMRQVRASHQPRLHELLSWRHTCWLQNNTLHEDKDQSKQKIMQCVHSLSLQITLFSHNSSQLFSGLLLRPNPHHNPLSLSYPLIQYSSADQRSFFLGNGQGCNLVQAKLVWDQHFRVIFSQGIPNSKSVLELLLVQLHWDREKI